MLVQAMKENDDDLVRKMISYNENSNEIYWDEYYENRYGMILVSELLDNISNAAICDMACGHGEQLLNIKQTECYLAGCELDKGRVDWCRNKGLDIHNSDALNTGFKDESFDIVLCEEILEHIKNPKMLINEAKRILKHNGILYLSTPWGDECGSENHVNDIYSLMIECGFAVENIVTIPYCVKDCYDNSIFVGARNIE